VHTAGLLQAEHDQLDHAAILHACCVLLFRYCHRFECVDRLVQGLSALFLALRRRPVIRYQKNSSAAQRLAEGLYGLTYKQQVRWFMDPA